MDKWEEERRLKNYKNKIQNAKSTIKHCNNPDTSRSFSELERCLTPLLSTNTEIKSNNSPQLSTRQINNKCLPEQQTSL
jgi:hypothetical protein